MIAALRTVTVFVSCTFAALAQQAQQQPKPLPSWSTNVRLIITAPEDIESLMTSFVSRELRALKDVTISDEPSRGGYIIEILGIEIASGGTKVGYALSVTVYSLMRGYAMALEKHLKEPKTGATIAMLDSLKSDAVKREGHYVSTTTHEALYSQCRDLIAKIDADIFESARRERQAFMDWSEQLLREKNNPKK